MKVPALDETIWRNEHKEPWILRKKKQDSIIPLTDRCRPCPQLSEAYNSHKLNFKKVPLSQRIHAISITKTAQLMSLREIIHSFPQSYKTQCTLFTCPTRWQAAQVVITITMNCTAKLQTFQMLKQVVELVTAVP
jgi:hypothetical protein